MEESGELDEGAAEVSAKLDKPSDGKNESGIDSDLNETGNHSVCDVRTVSDDLKDTNVGAISADIDIFDVSENMSLNCSGMKKDDSGIYSERSPVSGITKDISDGDLTESITESFEENASLEQRYKMNLDVKDADLCDSSGDVVVEMDDDDKKSDAKNKACDEKEINNLNSNELVQSQKSEERNLSNNQSAHEDFKKSLSENENLKVKKLTGNQHVNPLVDYDTSDNDKGSSNGSGEEGQIKPRKCFRKRKSDSNENSDENTDRDNESVPDNDGTPILLRHTEMGESDLPDIVHLSDMESDESSDTEAKTKDESSESELEDTPMELSKFGPPKHKWRALFDLRDRECGYSVCSEPGYFRKKIQGSLQMVQRFELQYKMDHHEGCVNALHFNRIGTLLASGSDDLNIVIWNWLKNKPSLIYDSGHRSNVFQSKFMPFSGDCHVVSCARDGQIRLADLSSTGVCKGTKKLAQHRGAAHKLALEMDSPHVFLSCGEDAITFEIDLRCDKANRLVTTKENDRKVALYSIHSNPCNSNEFVVSGRDHFIRIYDKRKIKEDVDEGVFKKFCPHHLSTGDKPDTKANVTCATYNYNGTEVLGTYNDEDIYLFSNEHSDGANYIHKYTGHRNNQTVKGVNFYGPQSEFIVSGSDCGHIFLWDKATENIVQFMEGDDGGVINVLEPHPFSPVLATSGLDHDIKIWAPTSEKPTKLKGLKKLTKRNSREREEERSSDGGMVDGAMLWYLMHHLRRGRRRREREARRERGESPTEGEEDDDTSDTLSDESSHSDSDSEAGPHERIQCAPS